MRGRGNGGGGGLLLSVRGGRGGATALSVRIPSPSWTGRAPVIQEESDTELN